MSTDRESFAAALSALDVETVHAPPSDVGTAIEAFVVGDAVGIADDSWAIESRPDRPAGVDFDPTPAALDGADTGVTPAAFAVADYGSLVLPTDPPACELVALHVDRHVAVVDAADVVPDMDAAFDRLDDEMADVYRDAVVATGPSATADMGELVVGAHGPSEVRVVVLEGE